MTFVRSRRCEFHLVFHAEPASLDMLAYPPLLTTHITFHFAEITVDTDTDTSNVPESFSLTSISLATHWKETRIQTRTRSACCR